MTPEALAWSTRSISRQHGLAEREVKDEAYPCQEDDKNANAHSPGIQAH